MVERGRAARDLSVRWEESATERHVISFPGRVSPYATHRVTFPLGCLGEERRTLTRRGKAERPLWELALPAFIRIRMKGVPSSLVIIQEVAR